MCYICREHPGNIEKESPIANRARATSPLLCACSVVVVVVWGSEKGAY